MPERVDASVEIVEPVNEGAHEAEERIGPVRAELRGLAEGRDRFREFLPCAGRIAFALFGFSCDSMEVTVAILRGSLERTVIRIDRERPDRGLANRQPLRFTQRRKRIAVVRHDVLAQLQRAVEERTPQPTHTHTEIRPRVQRVIPFPYRLELG